MAWIFSLSAECGPQREDAERFAAYWPAQLIRSDGTTHALSTWVHRDLNEGFWCSVAPDGVSIFGIDSDKDQREMDELARQMLELLRTAPYFRYAGVGVEVGSFREFSELDQDLVNLDFNGVVVSQDIWRSLGSPPIFEQFNGTHKWRPFVKAS